MVATADASFFLWTINADGSQCPPVGGGEPRPRCVVAEAVTQGSEQPSADMPGAVPIPHDDPAHHPRAAPRTDAPPYRAKARRGSAGAAGELHRVAARGARRRGGTSWALSRSRLPHRSSWRRPSSRCSRTTSTGTGSPSRGKSGRSAPAAIGATRWPARSRRGRRPRGRRPSGREKWNPWPKVSRAGEAPWGGWHSMSSAMVVEPSRRAEVDDAARRWRRRGHRIPCWSRPSSILMTSNGLSRRPADRGEAGAEVVDREAHVEAPSAARVAAPPPRVRLDRLGHLEQQLLGRGREACSAVGGRASRAPAGRAPAATG